MPHANQLLVGMHFRKIVTHEHGDLWYRGKHFFISEKFGKQSKEWAVEEWINYSVFIKLDIIRLK